MPVPTALYNVEQSSGNCVAAWQVWHEDSDCDDCDPIKMWICAKYDYTFSTNYLLVITI